MASQFGQRIVFILLLCFATTLQAQTVYYPAQSSDLLKSTANDVAALFTKAIPQSNFNVKEYTSIPSTGIVFIYDSTMINDQSCKIESTGNLIKFSAAQDAGLCFGIYNYLDELGFRFYLPGTLWEKIPPLASPYKQGKRIAVQKFKYNNWFISGGYNKWAMDQDASFGDAYFGKNGHEWSQYKRRNNMNGAYRFSGHRGDIFNTEYLTTLKANPCYIACRDGERKATSQAVPDINNNNALEYWASAIQQRYTAYKKIILSSPILYKNIYRNFNYGNEYIGIEVADGSAWGNSTDNLQCAKGNFNDQPYPRVSNQQFTLANFTASKISSSITGKHFQCYAYSGHADVPSSNITINKNIDVQVVASAFQSESTPAGLLNRWYQRHQNISEYDYINIPQWTGETPIFSLNNYKNTLSRIKLKNAQGLVMEASPAKFASLPFLFAGNRYLQNDIKVDNSIDEFTSNMFPANVAVHIKQLLQYWGADNVMSGGMFTHDNKYKIPLFLQELNKAIIAAKNSTPEVLTRLQEFKAYVHYIILYYDFITDVRSYQEKSEKAGALCLYLAKINKLQLVNSYFLILDIVNKFPPAGEFNKLYNVTNGTAYKNGSLALISNKEIDQDFSDDLYKYASVTDYKFEDAVTIISKLGSAGLKPVDKIDVGIGYTNSYDYANRCDFYFYAPSAGKINIAYTPTFEMPGYGMINFTVEATDKPLMVILDQTITRESIQGSIQVNVPAAGLYRFSVSSKFKSSCHLIITTHGNTFFKGAFYGKRAENYRIDNFKSLPKYFYVPDVKNVYFSINNACYTNSCLTPDKVQNVFGLKDNIGKDPVIEVSPYDSSLYKMPVTAEKAGSFWQVTQIREYNFCFANISNIEIFAEPKPISAAAPVIAETETIVYPNPSNGIFNFKKNNAALLLTRIHIYNPQGKMIADISNSGSIDLSHLPAGVYIFSAQKDNGLIKGKLIKN